jgi:hypothetical protein
MTGPREDLVRRLVHEPPAQWPEALMCLRVDMQPMPLALRDALRQLSALQASERRGRFRFIPAAGLSFAGALAAVVAVYFAILRPSPTPLLLTFVQGEVRIGDESARTGGEWRNRETLELASEGVAALSAEEESSVIELRIHGDSRIRAESISSAQLEGRLERGRVLASLSRTSTIGSSRVLVISSPNAAATAMGTIFSVERGEAGSTTLTTFEGSVDYRRRWAALEELPVELLNRSAILSDVRSIFVKATAKVPSGGQSTVDPADFQKRLGRIGKLASILDSRRFVRLRGREDASAPEINEALAELEREFASADLRAENLRAVVEAFGSPPLVRAMTRPELDELRSELENRGNAERDLRYKRILEMPASDRETFRKEATRALGKAPQEIILVTGESIYGSVFGENGKYRVYTAAGIRLLEPNQVEEIRFE